MENKNEDYFITKISHFGKEEFVVCDKKCEKAWGVSSRPKVNLDSQNPDDIVYMADSDLGEAPRDPGTYEGGHGKPFNPDEHNKWCVRQCERSCFYKSKDEIESDNVEAHKERVYNQPWKH